MSYDLNACGLVTICGLRVNHNAGDYFTCFNNSNEINHYTTAGASSTMYLNYVGGDVSVARNAMYLENAGNVGIGTTSPSELLTIAGGGKIAAFKSDNTRRGVFYTNNDGTVVESDATGNDPLFLSSPGASGTVRIQTGGTTRMSIGTNVGIGTTSPGSELQIVGPNASGADFGAELRVWENSFGVTLQGSTKGNTYAFLGNFRYNFTTETNSVTSYFRSGHGLLFKDGVHIFSSEPGGTSGCIFTPSERFTINNSGNVGIGITSPSYQLHVNGTFYAAGSSQDYKEDICQYNTDSCLFMCLKPKAYQYKEEWKHLGKDLKSGTQIGLIAEEVAESHPELAVLVNEEDNQVVRNVDYEKLSIILLAEVQKLRQEVDQLNRK